MLVAIRNSTVHWEIPEYYWDLILILGTASIQGNVCKYIVQESVNCIVLESGSIVAINVEVVKCEFNAYGI